MQCESAMADGMDAMYDVFFGRFWVRCVGGRTSSSQSRKRKRAAIKQAGSIECHVVCAVCHRSSVIE